MYEFSIESDKWHFAQLYFRTEGTMIETQFYGENENQSINLSELIGQYADEQIDLAIVRSQYKTEYTYFPHIESTEDIYDNVYSQLHELWDAACEAANIGEEQDISGEEFIRFNDELDAQISAHLGSY